MYGHIEYRVQAQGAFSSIHVSMPGKITLELPDGTVYDMEYPQMEVEGLLSDTKVLNAIGAITVKDKTNNLKVIVKFDAQGEERGSGIIGFFTGPSQEETATGGLTFRRDLLAINLVRTNGDDAEDGEQVASATGSYLENITFEGDDAPIWDINDDIGRM